MAKFITAADAGELPPGSKKCLIAGNVPLILVNVEGAIRAILNVCPHAGLPLGDGELDGQNLTCPYHGYTFDTATGKNVDFEGDVPATVLPVRVENGKIEVDVASLD